MICKQNFPFLSLHRLREWMYRTCPRWLPVWSPALSPSYVTSGPAKLSDLFEKNPYMEKIYPDMRSRSALTVFKIYEGIGEWFDLSKFPIERASFSFGVSQKTCCGFAMGRSEKQLINQEIRYCEVWIQEDEATNHWYLAQGFYNIREKNWLRCYACPSKDDWFLNRKNVGEIYGVEEMIFEAAPSRRKEISEYCYRIDEVVSALPGSLTVVPHGKIAERGRCIIRQIVYHAKEVRDSLNIWKCCVV